MRCAASAIVCRPEEQKRCTVMRGTVTGQPARTAIWRAMFQPVAPSGLAQPMITSSTSSASTLALSSAACTTCPPIFAPCVLLSAPFQLLQSGVRAVETMTASVITASSIWSGLLKESLGVPVGDDAFVFGAIETASDFLEDIEVVLNVLEAAVFRKR